MNYAIVDVYTEQRGQKWAELRMASFSIARASVYSLLVSLKSIHEERTS